MVNAFILEASHWPTCRKEASSGTLIYGEFITGEMAEWLKAHAWKACIPQGIQGSNPCLSAIFSLMR